MLSTPPLLQMLERLAQCNPIADAHPQPCKQLAFLMVLPPEVSLRWLPPLPCSLHCPA